mgnify:CR=1 FL=1
MIYSEFPTRGDFKKANDKKNDKNADKKAGKKRIAATKRERKLLILFRELPPEKQQSLIEKLDKN